MRAATVYAQPADVDNRLAEIGLNKEILLEAVHAGQMAWAVCTPNHPGLYPGLAAWAETVKTFRDLAMPEGWTRSDEGNLPFTVAPSGAVALTVATGDENTGCESKSPCTKSTKGPRTKKAIKENKDQLRLFGDVRLLPEDLRQVNGRMTWILLIHRDRFLNEVRCELARPVKMNPDGRVDGWAERIILGSIPLGGDVVQVPSEPAPQTPEIVVNINRRA